MTVAFLSLPGFASHEISSESLDCEVRSQLSEQEADHTGGIAVTLNVVLPALAPAETEAGLTARDSVACPMEILFMMLPDLISIVPVLVAPVVLAEA